MPRCDLDHAKVDQNDKGPFFQCWNGRIFGLQSRFFGRRFGLLPDLLPIRGIVGLGSGRKEAARGASCMLRHVQDHVETLPTGLQTGLGQVGGNIGLRGRGGTPHEGQAVLLRLLRHFLQVFHGPTSLPSLGGFGNNVLTFLDGPRKRPLHPTAHHGQSGLNFEYNGGRWCWCGLLLVGGLGLLVLAVNMNRRRKRRR